MKSGETVVVLRALIARGVPAMALLGLVACATTTNYRAADKQSVMESGSAEKDLGGRVRLPFTANRNGRIGTHPPKCCSGSPSSGNT